MKPGDVVEPRLRHFLVERDDAGLKSVSVFDDQATALREYDLAERRGAECVLLGSDSLRTCLATHGSWFDLAGDVDELRRELCGREREHRQMAPVFPRETS